MLAQHLEVDRAACNVLFVRELDGLTCGVRCPPWADVRELGHLPLPVSGLYTGETLTPHEWAALCAAWGETLPAYSWQKAGLIE